MTATIQQDTGGRVLDYEAWQTISRVEGDRYCDECGYNLNRQAVRRDPATGVLFARCPECGTFHAAGDMTTAGRLWLYRAGRILLVVWVFTAWASGTIIMLTQAMVTLFMLDILKGFLSSANPWNHPMASKWQVVMGFAVVISFLLGWATISACAGVFTHWKRWSYAIAAIFWPILSALFVWFSLSYVMYTARGTLSFQFMFALGPIAGYLVGGLFGVIAGRITARLSVRWLVPPSLWGVFAYLWTADGLIPPAARPLHKD